MKYRIVENGYGGFHLMRGDEIMRELAPHHEAAVQFWQEIEQLRASQAELVSALKATTLTLKAAIAGASTRGADEIIVCAEAAIDRAERKERGERKTPTRFSELRWHFQQ